MKNYLSFFLVLAISSVSISAHSVGYRNDVRKKIGVNNGQVWGEWLSSYFCPPGSLAYGYSLRVEPSIGDGDDTALNNISLQCTDGSFVKSSGAHWGSWGRSSTCGRGEHLAGFTLKVEKKQGDGDDTAANSFGGVCTNGAQINPENGGNLGKYSKMPFENGCMWSCFED